MRHDLLADTFCIIKNTEDTGRHVCVTPASSIIEGVLKVMQRHKYIGNYEPIDDGKGGKFKVHLQGRINDCGVVKPRFSIGRDEFRKWEKKFLPADNVGVLILTTSRGVMDQKEAEKKSTGGKMLGYVY